MKYLLLILLTSCTYQRDCWIDLKSSPCTDEKLIEIIEEMHHIRRDINEPS